MAKKCEEYISGLADYIDGAIDPELCEEIERHVGQCDNCRIMVDTLRQTVQLCRDGKPEPLPKALEDRLTSLLRAHWNKKFGKTE